MASKLLVLDGTGIVRRVWEAIKDEDADSRVEKTLQSSWGSFMRALREHEPTHFLGAFDHGGPTWRHALYPQYKCDRRPIPDALARAIPVFLDRLNQAGLRSVVMPGVEADDVMTSLAIKAVRRGFEVVVGTSDKDLLVLLDDGVQIYDHFKSQWRDEAWVRERYGVAPARITDLLSLWGDDEDGIPGIEGVGDKTAAKLLREYGDLAGVLGASDEGRIKGKVGVRIQSSKHLVHLSHKLATMRSDLEIGVTPRDLQLPAHLIPAFHAVPDATLVRAARADEDAAARLSRSHRQAGTQGGPAGGLTPGATALPRPTRAARRTP